MGEYMLDNLLNNELIGPFEVDADCKYYDDLKDRFNIFNDVIKSSGAEQRYIEIVKDYTCKVLNVIEEYYKGNIIKSQNILYDIVSDLKNDEYAVDDINHSKAFIGSDELSVDFFRGRVSGNGETFQKEEMTHIPFKLRERTKNERFSISGLPCLYLGNTSYCCWLELGKPIDGLFNVSPVKVRNKKILNLAVSICDWKNLHGFGRKIDENIAVWLKLIVLMIATSYRVKNGKDRFFKSEYIVSQNLMIVCKDLGIDGIAYYSKQVVDERLAYSAVNVALFAEYNGNDDSVLLQDVAIEEPVNMGFYKQLATVRERTSNYKLRIETWNFLRNYIGTYKRQPSYKDTEFFKFDKYLFKLWENPEDIKYGFNRDVEK